MLSWSPAKGALPPGGDESKGGTIPADLNVREALDFTTKLARYKTAEVELYMPGIHVNNP